MADIIIGKEVNIFSLIKPTKKYKTVNMNKTYKVVDKDDKFLYVVFFAKVRKQTFKSNRSLLATYKVIKKPYPIDYKVDVVGKNIHSLEKKKEEKIHRSEKREVVKKINLEKNITSYIDDRIKEVLSEEKKEHENLFKEELSRLQKLGVLFLHEHQDLTLSQLVKISSKKLSADGWRYCFDYEDKGKTFYHFQRPIQKKRVASTSKR